MWVVVKNNEEIDIPVDNVIDTALENVPTWVDYMAYVCRLGFKSNIGSDTCQ